MPVLTVVHLTAHSPRGTDFVATARPPLSWRVQTTLAPWAQDRAELELRRDRGVETAVVGEDSVRVPWPFEPLSSGEEASFRVRVSGSGGMVSDWSESLRIRAGFLEPGGWAATSIGLAEPSEEAQPGLARSEFNTDGEVRQALVYATALGGYQVSINGTDVDDHVLKPGWTSYAYRNVYDTTDVTRLLKPGRNAIGVRFAGAWATERFGFRTNARRVYANQPGVAVQLRIDYVDGRRTEVLSDGSWRTSTGPLLASGIYPGETYDARADVAGWSEPDFDDSGWRPAAPRPDIITPQARVAPPVRRFERLSVREVITSPSGRTLLDFGQNLVGRLRLEVAGPAGTVVTLRHAEVLEHGELGTRPLRGAAATDRYTLRGGSTETWEPEFTFHGFRYAEVEGWPGTLDPSAITAVVVHSDMARTGWFSCSDDLVNRLHENVVWGQRGNFLSVPTDCPQRDERLGWTGDIQVFAPTATFLFDCRDFLASWLVDLACEQQAADGVVPFVVPHVLGEPRPAAAWGDAATVVPSVLYERFGDRDVLHAQLESMRAWTDLLLGLAGERHLWEGDFQYGDWLDPTAPPEYPAEAKTSQDLVATAYVFRSAVLTSRAADLLGDAAAAAYYAESAAAVRAAFLAEYVTPAGRMMSDAQTAYALAIVFGLAPPEQHQALGDRLAELVRENGYRIGTGFVGTPIINDALTSAGHRDVAARLLLQTECPSWLYPVTMGATTIWERWDSMLPDGTINPGQMTSFNHYAFGAVADWLHRVLSGLAPAAPGYRRLRIEPHPMPGFDFAEAAHETPYGKAAVRWDRFGDDVAVRATVPPGVTADVLLPDGAFHQVGSGEHVWTAIAPLSRPKAQRLSLRSGLAQIIDDPEGYRVLVDVLSEMDTSVADEVRNHTAWIPGRAIGELLERRAPAAVRQRIADDWDALNIARGVGVVAAQH
jgi:alpha-L-rhamnosidase